MLGIRWEGFGRLTADGKQIAVAFGGGSETVSSAGRIHLERGRKAALEISYGGNNGKRHAELIWTDVEDHVSPQAIAAAKDVDVVIAVVGITSQLEGVRAEIFARLCLLPIKELGHLRHFEASPGAAHEVKPSCSLV